MKDKYYMEEVDVAEAIANTSCSPDDPQNNCVAGQTRTKDNTKRLAVTAIASEMRGEEGITKCASTGVRGNFATLARQLPPASVNASGSFD